MSGESEAHRRYIKCNDCWERDVSSFVDESAKGRYGRTTNARFRKRYRISSNATESVQNSVAATSFSNLVGNLLGSYAIPAFFVQEAAVVVKGEVAMSLGEVFSIIRSTRSRKEYQTHISLDAAVLPPSTYTLVRA